MAPIKFELDRLTSYSDEEIIKEIHRVAKMISSQKITNVQFRELSRVGTSTLHRHFGGLKNALKAAGFNDRVDDSNEERTKEEIIIELKKVAKKIGSDEVTKKLFNANANFKEGAVISKFGSWKNAIEAAGLRQGKSGFRFTDEECFENMLNVWTQLGRRPKYRDMNAFPSKVGPKAYIMRWKTWLSAVEAFVERVNLDEQKSTANKDTIAGECIAPDKPKNKITPRDIPLSIRYKVIIRDHHRCVLCGRSPATHLGLSLHVDHIIPWSKGGATTLENLRLLCSDCNLGKGNRIEHSILETP